MCAASSQTFRSLHRSGDPLRLLNAWDAGSARVFERMGAPAIGTTSAGIAYSLGRPDGEQITRDELIDGTAQIVDAVDVPVTADVESGYGTTCDGVTKTVRQVASVGAVGINIEDASGEPASPLRTIDEQTARIEAARRGAEQAGVDLFINARTDVCLLEIGVAGDRSDLVVERAIAFRDAGADGIFVPRATVDVIERIVTEIELPLNALALSAEPSLDQLAALGVARVSVGSGPIRSLLGLQIRIAEDYLERGSVDAMLDGAIGYAQANELFGG